MHSRGSSGWARASPAPAVLSEAAIVRAVDALAGVPRQDAQPRRQPLAPDRDRGLPRRRRTASISWIASATEVGIELEIVDRETEARLAATGCTPLVDPAADGVILFDIGGGSSELVRLGRCAPMPHGPPHPEIEAWISMPIGVVTLGRAPRRRDGEPRVVRGDDRGGRGLRRSLRRRARRHRRPAPARHIGHGDDHRRRLSRSAALRAPPRRWLLAERRSRSPTWSSGCWP